MLEALGLAGFSPGSFRFVPRRRKTFPSSENLQDHKRHTRPFEVKYMARIFTVDDMKGHLNAASKLAAQEVALSDLS
jgi:hypothetical protein